MLKYIILQEPDDGPEAAYFCLAPTKHLQLALDLQAARHGRRILSAGFVEWVDGQARTYGYSDSLDLVPRPEDARLLTVFARCTADAAAATLNRQPQPAHP